MVGIYTNSEIWFAESLDLFVKNLAEAQPTVFLGVPRIWTKFQMGVLAKLPQNKLNILLSIPIVSGIIKKKILTGLGLQRCKHYITGAAPISPSLVNWWEKLGVDLEEVYAMTENCAISHANRKPNFKIGTQGIPMPGVEMKLSEVGEILVKVPCNMQGYYKEPELTANTLRDGWLHTGDKGVVDSDGFLKITGRVKEIFKTDKGKYIAPAPIEMKISKNHFIEQICVVGSTLPQPIGLVVLSIDGRAKEKDYIKQSLAKTLEIINPELEKHERIHKLVVLQEEWTIENGLLTPTMKIKRNPIEDKYQPHYDTWYSHSELVVFEG
jgi:long-subunit acyl-CoA synthetase (AMP-forming)